MTQAKLKTLDTEEAKRKVQQKNKIKSKYLNDKCVKIAFWILLTLGLFIIVSTFYLAINQRNADEIFDIGAYEGSNIIDQYSKYGDDMNISIVSRIMDDKITKLEYVITKGCEVKNCRMICMHAKELFSEIFESMNLNNCNFFETLVIYNQQFPNGILENNWFYAQRTIQEVTLLKSNITKIRSAAFNTPMFSSTFMLYWRNLNLQTIESGALLGLHSLKYLMIDTKINCLDRAFFQPIQTTLVYLKLNAEITISTNENIFGISKMEKLEYVDLSRNNFNGMITQKTFKSTPNLKYLTMSKNKITAISPDAFEKLIGKLLLLDLSQNMLTTLDFKVLAPLLKANSRTFVNLAMNGWTCNCDIQPLIIVYREYRNQFMDGLYCKAPHSLYGKFIDDVNLDDQNCGGLTSTTPEVVKSNDMDSTTEYKSWTHGGSYEYREHSNSVEHQNIHLRCWSIYDSESNSVIDRSDSNSIELYPSDETLSGINSPRSSKLLGVENEYDQSDSEIKGLVATLDYFDFMRPEYEFELHLFENNSVKITVLDYKDNSFEIHILWFDEDVNESSQSNTPCLRYANPFVITDSLENNKTYTFCYVHGIRVPISPFNCLPLHIPAEMEIEEDVWISQDQKPFTIGMLCLIFFISTFTGAIIAYFGIKAYPDLLEGSKNVLIVKKSDQTCYVSTISEADYMKKSSLKKKSSSTSIQKNGLPSKSKSFSQESCGSLDLTRPSSVKSSSTCFEDAFPPSTFVNVDYEMPKPADKSQLTYESRCIPNTYVASSPCRSPPPLPKRNSKSFSENTY